MSLLNPHIPPDYLPVKISVGFQSPPSFKAIDPRQPITNGQDGRLDPLVLHDELVEAGEGVCIVLADAVDAGQELRLRLGVFGEERCCLCQSSRSKNRTVSSLECGRCGRSTGQTGSSIGGCTHCKACCRRGKRLPSSKVLRPSSGCNILRIPSCRRR